MLAESFLAATLSTGKQPVISSAIKDVGVVLHELHPQTVLRHGYKKSSSQPSCLAVSESHVFVAQAEKAVINVYNRAKGSQEATVPIPERIHSLLYVEDAAVLIIGSEEGKLMLWEIGTGRLTISAASHIQAVSSLAFSGHDVILSGSSDATAHLWSLSRLISILDSSPMSSGQENFKSPIGTFSRHRSGITALASGHSSFFTNFAVSASVDQTCYLWSIPECQIVRTVLLPLSPLCLTVDPADRAVYVGYASGQIQNLDLYVSTSSDARYESIHSSKSDVAIQLKTEDAWRLPTESVGSALCLALSYDGTNLLTGHSNGKILSWDVAKKRFQKDVVDLAQPVTSIQMLVPEGFFYAKRPQFAVHSIVKPTLELSVLPDYGSLGIPAAYSLSAQTVAATRPGMLGDGLEDGFAKAMLYPGFAKELIDDALQEMLNHKSDATLGWSTDPTTDLNLAKAERMQSEIDRLKLKVEVLNKFISNQSERKLDRLKRQAIVGREKRQAFLDAKASGQDSYAAMERFEQMERDIEMEDSGEDVPSEPTER